MLYTGDFRIDPSEFYKFKSLHDQSGEVKRITSLYLDTTFCHPKWLSFPSREQTVKDLVALITEWLDVNVSHEVGIWYNCEYGFIFSLFC